MKLTELCPLPLPEGLNLPEEVLIGEGACKSLPNVVDCYLGKAILCVADPDTWNACPAAVRSFITADRRIERFTLEKKPHTDSETIEMVYRLGAGKSGLLALGSGTVNDVVKMAATRLGVPYCVLGTAASMNGYASGIAAILEGGLKTTQTATPPRAIVLDTTILREAPPELTQAGLGDLLSKPVSMADYWLSDQLEQSGYNELAARLVDRAVEAVKEKASGLPEGEREPLEALAKALVLSGVSMVVAGSSSPASGGEHLIGHLWDMQAIGTGRETRLHGAQVGLATCITAALYHRIVAIEKPAFVEPPAWEREAERIRAGHGLLADVVLAAFRRKHDNALARIRQLRDRWSALRDGLLAMKIPLALELNGILQKAGAPHTLKALDISFENAVQTVRLARDIRDRYTVLDLAYDLGVFPDAVEAVLQESGTVED